MYVLWETYIFSFTLLLDLSLITVCKSSTRVNYYTMLAHSEQVSEVDLFQESSPRAWSRHWTQIPETCGKILDEWPQARVWSYWASIFSLHSTNNHFLDLKGKHGSNKRESILVVPGDQNRFLSFFFWVFKGPHVKCGTISQTHTHISGQHHTPSVGPRGPFLLMC